MKWTKKKKKKIIYGSGNFAVKLYVHATQYTYTCLHCSIPIQIKFYKTRTRYTCTVTLTYWINEKIIFFFFFRLFVVALNSSREFVLTHTNNIILHGNHEHSDEIVHAYIILVAILAIVCISYFLYLYDFIGSNQEKKKKIKKN